MPQGLTGAAAESGTDILANDAQSDKRHSLVVDQATSFTTRSALCVVLKEGGATRGVVQLLNKEAAKMMVDNRAHFQQTVTRTFRGGTYPMPDGKTYSFPKQC